jgi:predicted negative regulator of RcsB-dependent stress response
MAERQHGETETRLAGFEARIQDGFAWANAHGREIVIGIVAFLIVGGVGAGIWEWQTRRRGAAETELARIEARFTHAMGATTGEQFISEPANAEQAVKAREATLAELDAFIAAQGASGAARIASLRAAEIEVDLGRLEVADKRLEALAAAFDEADARRAVALRLRGYVLDQGGNSLAAAEVYEAGARIQAYPPRVLLWIAAGDCFARAAQPGRAIAAYRQALAASPEVADQEGIVARIGVEQARLDTAPPSAPIPASDK